MNNKELLKELSDVIHGLSEDDLLWITEEKKKQERILHEQIMEDYKKMVEDRGLNIEIDEKDMDEFNEKIERVKMGKISLSRVVEHFRKLQEKRERAKERVDSAKENLKGAADVGQLKKTDVSFRNKQKDSQNNNSQTSGTTTTTPTNKANTTTPGTEASRKPSPKRKYVVSYPDPLSKEDKDRIYRTRRAMLQSNHVWPIAGTKLAGVWNGEEFTCEVIHHSAKKYGKALKITSGPAENLIKDSMTGAAQEATAGYAAKYGLKHPDSDLTNGWEFWKPVWVPEEEPKKNENTLL